MVKFLISTVFLVALLIRGRRLLDSGDYFDQIYRGRVLKTHDITIDR